MEKSLYVLTRKMGAWYRLTSTKTKSEVDLDELHFSRFKDGDLSVFSDQEIQTLFEMGFLVENREAEVHQVCDKIDRHNRENAIIILFPTLQCNFRCKYCYESKYPSKLDSRFYRTLLELIPFHSLKKLKIAWFGGEPSMELTDVVSFHKSCKDKASQFNCEVTGHMTTNFYLLNNKRFEQLVDAGITNFQVTLDGLEDVHDRYRPLANGGKTHNAVFQNLLNCKNSDRDFNITIRTNFDAVTDYKPFIRTLQVFKDDSRFVFSINEIFSGSPIKEELICTPQQALLRRKELAAIYKEYGLPLLENKEKLTFFASCYACHPGTVVLDEKGHVRKCTVHLNDPKNDLGVLGQCELDDSYWSNYRFKDCPTCRFFPICLGRMCRYKPADNRANCEKERTTEYEVLCGKEE